MINKKITNIIIAFLIVLVGFLAYIALKPSNKIVWINTTTVFNEFVLKKELESKFTLVEMERKRLIDSLELELNVLSKTFQSQGKVNNDDMKKFQSKREYFLLKKEQFEADNENMRESYNQQIYTQLNQYVKDFGTTNGYEYVLGAEGSGAVMFAVEKNDVTKEVISFINKKYKGDK